MPKKALILSAVALLLVCFILVVPQLSKIIHRNLTDAEYLQLFKEVVSITKQRYVSEVDDKKLMQGAINGMLSALDPHSNYMPVSDFTEMKVHMAGAFGGVGIELGMQDGKLMVNAPIEDTPAFRAGIMSGDHIWKIDGKPTKGLTINDAVSRMRGTPGTSVALGILRDGSPPLSFHLVRATIKTKSLKARLLESGYGYIGIAEFQERTGEDFEKALRTLAADNGAPLSGLVLDLRYNPGGLVDQAFKVADRFIGDGLSDGLIVTTKGREPSSTRSLTAYVGDKEPHYPMVVLINGGSASASEIVAGALQDHKRAVIMGTQSFGKGSVQSVIQLPNGDGLKLTTARYYTPSGRSIQAKGIVPDIVVEMNRNPAKAEKKPAELHEKDLDGHISADEKSPAPKPAPKPLPAPDATRPGVKPRPFDPKDPTSMLQRDSQLARALDLLKGVNLIKAQMTPPASPQTAASKK